MHSDAAAWPPSVWQQLRIDQLTQLLARHKAALRAWPELMRCYDTPCVPAITINCAEDRVSPTN